MFDYNHVLCLYTFVIITMFAGCAFALSEEEELWLKQKNAVRQHTCSVPQPRTISYEDALKEENKATGWCEYYISPIVVLNRCDFGSGCCIRDGLRAGTCGPAKIEKVKLVFHAYRFNSQRCLNRTMKRTIVMEAENHISCSCSREQTLEL